MLEDDGKEDVDKEYENLIDTKKKNEPNENELINIEDNKKDSIDENKNDTMELKIEEDNEDNEDNEKLQKKKKKFYSIYK